MGICISTARRSITAIKNKFAADISLLLLILRNSTMFRSFAARVIFLPKYTL